MNDITLGKCPFCGGRVSSAVESGREGALVAYWCVRPVCENGCPVGRLAVNAVLCFGCPGDGLVKSEAGTALLGLVVRWNGEAAAAESAGRRQAELEAECAILNRAYWPDRFKGE